jgi:hypothetical protein
MSKAVYRSMMFFFNQSAFQYSACDADPRSGYVLTSPYANFENVTSVRLNVSFPFNNLTQNNALMKICTTNSLGNVNRVLATIHPPAGRSYDMSSSGTNDGFYVFDICLPPGTYRLLIIGSGADNSTVIRSGNVTPYIFIHSIETRNDIFSCNSMRNQTVTGIAIFYFFDSLIMGLFTLRPTCSKMS